MGGCCRGHVPALHPNLSQSCLSFSLSRLAPPPWPEPAVWQLMVLGPPSPCWGLAQGVGLVASERRGATPVPASKAQVGLPSSPRRPAGQGGSLGPGGRKRLHPQRPHARDHDSASLAVRGLTAPSGAKDPTPTVTTQRGLPGGDSAYTRSESLSCVTVGTCFTSLPVFFLIYQRG